jgi:hypothetical protein
MKEIGRSKIGGLGLLPIAKVFSEAVAGFSMTRRAIMTV